MKLMRACTGEHLDRFLLQLNKPTYIHCNNSLGVLSYLKVSELWMPTNHMGLKGLRNARSSKKGEEKNNIIIRRRRMIMIIVIMIIIIMMIIMAKIKREMTCPDCI